VLLNFVALTPTINLSPPVTTDTARVEGARTPTIELPPKEDDADVEIRLRAPTAIELLYLRATPKDRGILVEWATLYEIDTYGFRLYRGTESYLPGAELVSFVAGRGSPEQGAAYQYLDPGLVPGRYYYWLVEVENGGRETPYGPAEAWSSPGDADLAYRFYLPILQR
jgi:hypothetical protein